MMSVFLTKKLTNFDPPKKKLRNRTDTSQSKSALFVQNLYKRAVKCCVYELFYIFSASKSKRFSAQRK